MSKRPSLIVGASVAAAVLGLSRRQFDRLHKAGVLPQHAPRQFDLEAVVPAYCRYIEQGREGAQTLAEAKLVTERERGRSLALANEVEVGALVYADQVAEVLAEISAQFVGLLEAIPGRHAAELVTVKDAPTMRAELLTIVRGVREQWANQVAAIADRLAAAK